MIHVDRGRVAAPAVLDSPAVSNALAAAAEHFASAGPRAGQTVHRFYSAPWNAVKPALRELFQDKCAFCESPRRLQAGDTHHFRPKQEAVDHNGSVSRPHYWWLAYAWENLYLACQRCNTAAGAHFPVAGSRARDAATGDDLDLEWRLLIDPCRDDPDDHLVFDDTGFVAARSERGKVTIEIFHLNRRGLVDARRTQISEALAEFALYDPVTRNLRSTERPYSAAVRQAVVRRAQDTAHSLGSLAWDVVPVEETKAAVTRQRDRPVEALSIERIEIRQFRGIEHLDLDLSTPEFVGIPWTMLLGENGHGKSSVLQAIALVLMGAAERDRLKLDVASLIRRGADATRLTVHVSGAIDPRTLRIDRARGRFEIAGDDRPGALAAYGAGRIPGRWAGGALPKTSASRPRVESLFDPRIELMPATPWLLSVPEQTFDFACRALRRLTLEDDTSVFERREDKVWLLRPDSPAVSLDDLSDGYRSVIAVAVDLMSYFMSRYGSMDAAEGIVLVDELGAHLHPRWQMRVVRAFRDAFPRLQFVTTTHDPLCLRGMQDDEVVVLRRTDAREIYALPAEEVPSVRGLRVDELLTSEVFGLNTTLDPDLDAKFDEYYALLASHERDEDRIAALRAELDAHRQLGSTRRERLALEAADDYLAHERNVTQPAARRELSEEAKQRLRAIWAADVLDDEAG